MSAFRRVSLRIMRSAVMQVCCLAALLLTGVPGARAEGPLYALPTDRFGAGLQPRLGAIMDYDVTALHLAWYSDWGAQQSPLRPAGMEYVQLIWVDEGTFHPALDQLGPMVDANPGAVWLIGNEPECIWQGNSTPEQYADVYYQLHAFIKQRDPSAQLAIGGVVQPTPLRLEWLDRVLARYQAVHGTAMPVDIWNIHIQILQEKKNSWGCEIPRGLTATEGRLYGIQDNDNVTVFRQLVVEFRTWMLNRGQRGKPLIISEYGVLFPPEYGYTAERVSAYMRATFDYLLSATDANLGYPLDENRLVQRWLWYSLNEQPYDMQTGDGFNGALFDYRYTAYPGDLTVVGEAFKAYVENLVGCSISGKVEVQRPENPAPHESWIVPLQVSVCGSSHGVVTDAAGRFSLAGLQAQRCDLIVKGAHSLSVALRDYDLVPGVNQAEFGLLKEGDANGDDCVNILDFSLLATFFLTDDPRCDFNGDGRVNIKDFSLLASNFGQCGASRITTIPSAG